jgi:hypothetical protein
MLKLDDDGEDVPGSVIEIFAAEHGEPKAPSRRPELVVDWKCRAAWTSVHEIQLERGRHITLPEAECRPGDWFAATFSPEPSSATPVIEVRERVGDDRTDWREVRRPFRARGNRVAFRIRAVRNPIELGDPFTATIRDTWVNTGPMETRTVLWRFRSPSGAEHAVPASYVGDYTWHVRFTPDEVGRWTYTWEHDFTSNPYDPERGEFDVVADDTSRLLGAMSSLHEEVINEIGQEGSPERERLCRKFMHLQRAVMTSVSPENWRGSEGEKIRTITRKIRSRLWGEQVPATVPMEAHPRDWTQKERRQAEAADRRSSRGLGLLVRIVRRIADAVARRFRR